MTIKHIIFHLDHVAITAIACLITLILALLAFNVKVLDPVAKALSNISVTDWIFKAESRYATHVKDSNIVIVDMTDLSSRADIGMLLGEVVANRPKAIGVDIIFEGESDDTEGDSILEAAARRAAPVTVFANKLVAYDKASGQFDGVVSSFFKWYVPVTEGYANVTDNMEHTTVRKLTISLPTRHGRATSLATQLARKTGVQVKGDKEIVINFKPTDIKVIPANKVKANPELLRGKTVLIGAFTEESDMQLTPVGKMPGVELQACSLLTLLDHDNIHYLSRPLSIAIGLVLCYIYSVLYALVALFIRTRRPSLRIYLTESRLMLSLTALVYISLLTLMAYAVFVTLNVYVDMVIVLAMVAFVPLSLRLYSGLVKVLRLHQLTPFTGHSLY